MAEITDDLDQQSHIRGMLLQHRQAVGVVAGGWRLAAGGWRLAARILGILRALLIQAHGVSCSRPSTLKSQLEDKRK